MAKLKKQKQEDLEELTQKLKNAKSVVLSKYSGTTVKDLDKFRNSLRKEKVFSKVYKITLIKKALEAVGIAAASIDYKTPVILSVSQDDETTPARIIKALGKELKTMGILQGVLDGKLLSQEQVSALADLPSKDQLRAQFMSVLNGPIAAFARVLNARSEKIGESLVAPAPAAEPVAA